jgi:hypothetical protein
MPCSVVERTKFRRNLISDLQDTVGKQQAPPELYLISVRIHKVTLQKRIAFNLMYVTP